MAKEVKVTCLVNKVMNAMTLRLNDDDGHIVLLDPTMSDV